MGVLRVAHEQRPGEREGVHRHALEPVAGALWRPDTLARAAALGLDAQRFLDANDAHTFFSRLGDQLVTGPTRTNVNDFRAVLVLDATGAPRRPGSG